MGEFEEGVDEVLSGDVFAEEGGAKALEEDEADAAVLEFLVAGGEGEGAVCIDSCREGEGEFQRAQCVEHIALLGGTQPGVAAREECSQGFRAVQEEG